MKKMLFPALMLLTAAMYAQQKQGTVIYTRTVQMQLNINNNDQIAQMLHKTRTDKFVLTFANDQSIWKHVDEEDNTDEMNSGIQIRLVTQGQNDVVFYDFSRGKKTEQREMMERKYIITDSVQKLDWKLSGESQTLLGHICRKATARRAGKRMQMTMDNGKMERKEVDDTSIITAWFTTDIPVPAGPEVQGQLPGLILALDIDNGRVLYSATELSAIAAISDIKEPVKGKKVTPEEYLKETAKMVAEMKKNHNNDGDRRVVHMAN